MLCSNDVALTDPPSDRHGTRQTLGSTCSPTVLIASCMRVDEAVSSPYDNTTSCRPRMPTPSSETCGRRQYGHLPCQRPPSLKAYMHRFLPEARRR